MRNNNLSKKRQVINHLARGWGICPREAAEKYGVGNLRATISNIREMVPPSATSARWSKSTATGKS